ncbi:fatty acyl-AMP ligase [Mycolicibacter longobardus]|uniref:Fatty-acid--CoA ligase n=1 Tax=Mycolicibacter longobardus TaxID=1108812 RepID=A0A1X1YF99_9MYCO|nr:fatty acyl-AMP ligase [Mycolicibacter longobardus]MCV7386011.1 fatty acyl-AMP ligase [Mycolicibacter longobardus]ORW09757.1 fatty-acid--CoA ligase [Mycolicibacter longobardus]
MPEQITPPVHTLVDLLRLQADRYGDKVAFSFAPDGKQITARLTYRELDTKARAIATDLQHQGAAGQRALVICRPGLDSIVSFFGCFYAGAIAVPVDTPLARLKLVAPDAQAPFAVATSDTRTQLQSLAADVPGMSGLRWCATDQVNGDPEDWEVPDVDPSTTALIQYTSGSTKSPKGVVVTHDNLIHNLEAIRRAWRGDENAKSVYFLPQQHDMGLIGGVLEMIYVGCSTVLMSPIVFFQRPMAWLEAMSRYRATTTAAPNAAYRLCVKHSNAAQRAALDLSHWSTAAISSEQIHATTMQEFAEAFAPAGFRLEAFRPAYGLAEATLLVTGDPGPAVAGVRYVDGAALGENRAVDTTPDDAAAVALVSCGPPVYGQRVMIVDPETRRQLGPDEVGEVWVSGPSVAQGYWARPVENAHTFAGFLADTGEGPFLRTGDLGFLCKDELFVTGRWSDLITLRDSTYYPNNIEPTVQACHPALLADRGAVVAVPSKPGADNHLVVLQEVDYRQQVAETEYAGIMDAIRAAITEQHGIEAHDVLLVPAMRLPTTSSGKIQRGECRRQFLNGALGPVAQWHAPEVPVARAKNPPTGASALARILATGLAQRQQPGTPPTGSSS